MVDYWDSEALKLASSSLFSTLIQSGLLLCLILVAPIIHVLLLEDCDFFRTAGNETECPCAFASDNFEDLDPHFARESYRERYRRYQNQDEDDPSYDIVLHDRFTLTSLIVQTEVNGDDDHSQT